jgi:transcriptional regulator with PAS, ATPase and Fis domain
LDTQKDVRTRASFSPTPSESHLFVVLEGGRPTAGGLRFALTEGEPVLVGRGDERRVGRHATRSEITLEVPDAKVSRRHALIRRKRGYWELEDLGSTNGTHVNGRRVQTEALCDGDVIEMGQTVFRLRTDLCTPAGSREVTAGLDDRWASLDVPTLLPEIAGELDALVRVAPTKVPVLLLGDTGTGKEVVARGVHAASGRVGAFIPVNCAALPETLVESQLFGHMKGSFSGAIRDQPGFARAAQGGTLFLDEIGDLPPAAQGALLRVLQEGEVVPVGSTCPVAVDIRIIAATHQPIHAMVEQGVFRNDLLARLQGFTQKLWPLADRREDMGLLIARQLPLLWPQGADSVRIAPDAARALVLHRWPHNVRELVQALARALPLAHDGLIELEHLPPALREAGTISPQRTEAPANLTAAQAALRLELTERLVRSKGNVALVAREMNKATMQVYRWMRSLDIDPRAFR